MVTIITNKNTTTTLTCDEIKMLISAVRSFRLRLSSTHSLDAKIDALIREQARHTIALEHKLHELCG